MDCEKIKNIISGYVAHTISEEECRLVEEHLCICQSCRDYLGIVLDRKEQNKPEDNIFSTEFIKKNRKNNIDIITFFVVGAGMIMVFFSLYLFFRSY